MTNCMLYPTQYMLAFNYTDDLLVSSSSLRIDVLPSLNVLIKGCTD